MSDYIDPSGGGAAAVDPEQVRRGNIAAVNGLYEGGRVEYWVFQDPEGGATAVVVGRDHEPLVYQAVQTWAVESSGYVEVYNGRAHAAEAANSFYATSELEDLGPQTRFEKIYLWAPERTEVDFATISARNQANIKATGDGERVPFRTVVTPTAVILLVGAGHPDTDSFGMDAQESSAGEIEVKKGRLFNAGKLNVIGANANEQWSITSYLNEFSDKAVVFDEGQDDPDDEPS